MGRAEVDWVRTDGGVRQGRPKANQRCREEDDWRCGGGQQGGGAERWRLKQHARARRGPRVRWAGGGAWKTVRRSREVNN